ncbi:hypothetical protein K438DRAFT_1748632 [Mycena galopus ATCC 62051]|nr:hypothetical protein K438DRAFT_1748632 [Mycena galopus ATCC 62051]
MLADPQCRPDPETRRIDPYLCPTLLASYPTTAALTTLLLPVPDVIQIYYALSRIFLDHIQAHVILRPTLLLTVDLFGFSDIAEAEADRIFSCQHMHTGARYCSYFPAGILIEHLCQEPTNCCAPLCNTTATSLFLLAAGSSDGQYDSGTSVREGEGSARFEYILFNVALPGSTWLYFANEIVELHQALRQFASQICPAKSGHIWLILARSGLPAFSLGIKLNSGCTPPPPRNSD